MCMFYTYIFIYSYIFLTYNIVYVCLLPKRTSLYYKLYFCSSSPFEITECETDCYKGKLFSIFYIFFSQYE